MATTGDDAHRLNVKDLLFFSGKELSETIIGGRRTPPRPIRLAIGKHGLYKFEPEQDKVLAFWSFSEIKDWNFSGYSFTLTFTSNKDYYIRTDEGPTISQWLESFTKNAVQAEVAAKQFKSLGAADNSPMFSGAANTEPKFYTLNTRKSKNMGSRMLQAYGVDKKQGITGSSTLRHSRKSDVKKSDPQRWNSIDNDLNKRKDAKKEEALTRSIDSLVNTHALANDKRSQSSPPQTNHTCSPIHSQISPNSSVEEEIPPAVPPRINSLSSDNGIMIKVSDREVDLLQKPTTPRSHAYEEIEIGMRPRELGFELESGEYDHLTPSRLDIRHKKNKKNNNKENEEIHSPIRRNESLPPMTFHSPLRDVPTIDVTQSQELSDEDCSPIPSPNDRVLLRKKSNDSIASGEDPFADLLTAPTNRSHLRWSQELNPIYDYIRGTKVKPSVGYDISRNAEDTIAEEPSSPFEDTASIGSEDQSSIGSGDHFEGLVFVPQSAPNTLQRHKRQQHNYEEVVIGAIGTLAEEEEGERSRSNSRSSRPRSEHYQSTPEPVDVKSATLSVKKLKNEKVSSVSPRLNKRMIQRRSKTVRSADDSNAPQGRQKAQRMTDTMKDFSYITREYRLFFIKLPNGQVISEVVNINKPVSQLLDRLLDILGIPAANCVGFSLYVEGSILTTMKEATLEFGEVQTGKAQIEKSVSLMQLVDNTTLTDQGSSPILLKPSISLRMQGITTSRILRLEEPEGDNPMVYPSDVDQGSQFHKHWLAVVQGNHPCTLDNAVKLAAMQYQAYFVERTAENSVIGFCRPTEFLPAEFAGVRGIEQKMYKEQEKIKSKSQGDIQQAYIDYCTSLDNCDTMFFPVREPRRRLFQNTRLKPVLLGVNKSGIMRVCPKTKEVLDKWEYQVLKNWAYSKRTFVIAFNNKNYPVESSQAKWISELVDFFVDSIIHSSPSRE